MAEIYQIFANYINLAICPSLTLVAIRYATFQIILTSHHIILTCTKTVCTHQIFRHPLQENTNDT